MSLYMFYFLFIFYFPDFHFNSYHFLQVTKGMFGARKKFPDFVEVIDNDFSDDMYYNQPSMFPHRSDKDVSFDLISTYVVRYFIPLINAALFLNLSFQILSSPSPSSSGQLSQLAPSLYGPQSEYLQFLHITINGKPHALFLKGRLSPKLLNM